MNKAAVFLSLFFVLNSAGAEELIWEDISKGNVDYEAVLASPGNPQIILAATKARIIKSKEDADFKQALAIPINQRVSLLFQDNSTYYCLTTNGLYISNNGGHNWKRSFRGRNQSESNCTSIAISPNNIYLGTQGGLFLSSNKGKNWKKEPGMLGNCSIYSLCADPAEKGYVYAASSQGAFRKQFMQDRWEKIFPAYPVGDAGNDSEEKPDDPEENSSSSLNDINTDSGFLYIATSKGVFKSKDKGAEWEHISDYGLLSGNVRKIFISKNKNAYALTRSGIFILTSGRWQELTFTLAGGQIRSFYIDNNNILYAACEKGLFKSKKETNTIIINNDAIQKNEPGIKEIQKAAIDYAEVNPEKIALWRKKAAIKAMLPQLSAGVDRNTNDLWHWESGSTTKNDDDTLRRGDDALDWDVRLTWDLGELIWNEDQTSIDNRSRLMVQLRGDILDEVNKLYYERIRAKADLDNITLGDKKKLFEKELKVQELTAQLDGLTGGYFSQHLK